MTVAPSYSSPSEDIPEGITRFSSQACIKQIAVYGWRESREKVKIKVYSRDWWLHKSSWIELRKQYCLPTGGAKLEEVQMETMG